MDTHDIKQYLLNKDTTWQHLFCDFYLARHGLLQEAIEWGIDFDITDSIRFCRNENGLIEVWELIDELNAAEEELTDEVMDLRFSKPIAWQYSFVEEVAKATQTEILQTLDLHTLIDAYCLAVSSPKIDLDALIEELDARYVNIFASVNKKMALLKRNFLLVLECRYGNTPIECPNFRELLEYYMSRGGRKGIIDAYKHALTPDLKLTSAEKICLAFAYYSPYFCDFIALANNTLPDSSVLQCTEDYINVIQNYLKELSAEEFSDDDDEDEYDEDDFSDDADDYEDENPTHYAVYVDPQELCLVDVQTAHNCYAHVYIEDLDFDKGKFALNDFIMLRKGCLYTVEFVDDIHNVVAGTEVSKRLNAAKGKLVELEKNGEFDPKQFYTFAYKARYNKIRQALNSCFCYQYY